ALRHQTNLAFLARLEAIPATGFSDQDQLSHDLMVRVLQQRIVDYDLKQYEDYIARLHQIPRVLSQTTEVLRAGMRDKLMPVKFLAEKLPVQCEGIVAADPFLLPTKKYPPSISPEDQKRLTEQITA